MGARRSPRCAQGKFPVRMAAQSLESGDVFRETIPVETMGNGSGACKQWSKTWLRCAPPPPPDDFATSLSAARVVEVHRAGKWCRSTIEKVSEAGHITVKVREQPGPAEECTVVVDPTSADVVRPVWEQPAAGEWKACRRQ